MLIEYIRQAMLLAKYEILPDGMYYGEIPALRGCGSGSNFGRLPQIVAKFIGASFVRLVEASSCLLRSCQDHRNSPWLARPAYQIDETALLFLSSRATLFGQRS